MISSRRNFCQSLGLSSFYRLNGFGSLQDDFGAFVDGDVHHLPIDAYGSRTPLNSLFEGGNDPASILDTLRGRRKNFMKNRNLIRMDASGSLGS